MTRIVIDFETYYDKDYSLKKMTMEQYIRDLRFECIGLSIKVGDQLTQFFRAETWIPELKQLLITHRDHTIVSHNAMFDMGILGIRYGIHPRNLGDTVSMSAVVGLDRCAGRANLDGLSEYLRTIGYNIPTKGDYVQNMESVRIADMSPTDWAQYSEYCKTDSDICAAMYDIMLPFMPAGEMEMISTTLKMFTNPAIKLDTDLLLDYEQRLIQKREDLLSGVARRVGLSGADELAPHLRSTAKFAKLLESVGVTVPMKYSEKQDKMIPAVAKTDHEFLELVASEDELTSALCEARLGAASNLEMTRCKRFIDISNRGLMPIPLRYAAAHTMRYGGADKLNCFSAGHELLTPDGWVAVEQYTVGTPIAQWHEDATISFDHNPSWLTKPYKGLMYRIETPTVSLVVTPDHRISSVKQGKLENGFTVKTAEQIANCSGLDYIPLCGVVDTLEHPYTDAQIRYLVALQADGSIVKNRHLFGFRRERKIIRMNELLVDLGFKFARVLQANGTTLFTVTPPSEFAVEDKNFGSWILKLSARQLGLFVDELRYWDGNSNSNNGSLEYNSTVMDNVLWVDTAMRLCGRFSGVYGYNYSHGTTDKDTPYCWRLYERTSRYGSIDTKRHVTTQEFDGIVYCPKVDSDRILVRHNNKICVVHQCQNLPKRKGDKSLRRSMTAPDDHVLIASDSSQIECRVLAYAAQELPLLNIFLNKDDPYSDMASNIYGLPYDVIYREAKIERTKEGIVRRNVGKTTELGCIAEGTEVLTDRGWVQIQHVQDDDLLWDGDEFVPHGGLLDRGFKPCAIFNNIALTTDHKIYNHISGRWFTVEDILYYTDLSLLADIIADTCNQYSFHDIPSKYRSHLVEARDNKLGINDFITRPILKTYDILNVGTKNCFYVRSINRGSGSSVLKVHNCGYGMGADKFEGQLKLDGLTEAASNAKAIVQAYRRARPSIVRFWKTCSDVLDIMLAGGKVSFGGPNNDLFVADGSSVFWGKRIPSVRLPNGTYIWYQNLRKVPRQEPAQFGDGMEFVYDQFKSNRFEVNRIYGGKLTENLIQALAFAVLKYQALRIVDMGVPVHMNVHDEWVSIVPKSMAHHAVAVHAKAMRTVPNYIPDGLLDMELDMGKNYADTTTIGGL